MDSLCTTWSGLLIGIFVGVVIIAAIEVVRWYIFEAKLEKEEAAWVARHRQMIMFEVEWNLRYSGLSDTEVQDIVAYINQRWDDDDHRV